MAKSVTAVVQEKPVKAPKLSNERKGSGKKAGRGIGRPFRAVGGYFAGAWNELRQVRWPNRSATWGLTLAVILFSIFFAALILGLDTGLSYLFKEILL